MITKRGPLFFLSSVLRFIPFSLFKNIYSIQPAGERRREGKREDGRKGRAPGGPFVCVWELANKKNSASRGKYGCPVPSQLSKYRLVRGLVPKKEEKGWLLARNYLTTIGWIPQT